MPYIRPIYISIFIIFSLVVFSFLMFEQPIVNSFKSALTYFENQPLKLLWIALLIVLVLVIDILLPVPSSLIAVLAGTFLGFPAGAAVIWLGLSGGALVGYFLGYGLHRLLPEQSPLKKDLRKASVLSKNIDGAAIILMRGIPVMAETSVIAAGLIRYPFKKFLVITSLANIGIASIYAWTGSHIQSEASILLIVSASVALPSLAFLVKMNFEFFIYHSAKTASLSTNKALTNLGRSSEDV